MNAAEWIGLATLAVIVVGAIYKQGRTMGEIKSGVMELLNRTDRGERRVDSIELRLNDHTERIARLEGRD